jgi:hypothetical protein
MIDAEMPVIQSSQLYLDWDAIGWEDWRWGANSKRDPKGIYWERPGASNMGVEAAVWSERMDPSNLECRVWPRTSALAEDAWAGLATLQTHIDQHGGEEAKRTALMIERMSLLGIAAFAGENKERACSQLGDDKQHHHRPVSLVDVIDTAGGKGTSGGSGPLPDNAQGFGSP